MPMLTLRFKKDEKNLGDFVVENGKSLTIGRLEDNDIVIEDLAVSGHHAKIDSVGDKFLVTDLNSKNGTLVNETLISHPRWLRHGDIIIIGKHYLVFAYTSEEDQPEDVHTPLQDTMIRDTEQFRNMRGNSRAHPQSRHGTEKEPVGVLSFLAGGEGEIELTKKLTKIGKNVSSDIVISGLTIGQTAATISKRPNGFYLSYVGGFSKPKVNGDTVKESVQLNQFDTIALGSLKMQFLIKE